LSGGWCRGKKVYHDIGPVAHGAISKVIVIKNNNNNNKNSAQSSSATRDVVAIVEVGQCKTKNVTAAAG